MPSTRVRFASVSAGLLLVAGCSGGSDGDVAQVMATTTIWADVVEQVACGEIEVPSLIPAGADPHSHEPSVRDADQLRSTELLIANGLGLEGHLDDALEVAKVDGVRVHEVSSSLADHLGQPADEGRGEAVDAHGHDHEGDDPHLWMDPLLVAESVPGIADALGQVDGLDVPAADLERCASDYVDRLAELTETVQQQFAPIPAERRRIVTDHEALGHFAGRFDLDVIGSVVPSTDSLAEANPRDLDELEATMRSQGVEVVVVEQGSSRGLADSLAARLGGGAAVLELFTESIGAEGAPQSYLEMLELDGRLLAEALAP